VRDGCSHFVVSGFAESIENTGVWWGCAYDYGFSALPGGQRVDNGGILTDIQRTGSYGGWWTASDAGWNSAYMRSMWGGEEVGEKRRGINTGLSVRCIKDVR
jgi:uncharacterized protein (TIGR02145 family)